ncbi:MAG: glycosyltransferase [Candidatus Kerfeldbacteria bacterium]|nr:glycosyltransferase [Candidatus Kerfeldbacteria bacterium]
MKIAVLTNLYPPFVRGGAEYLAHQLALELVRQEHEVVVVTTVPFGSLRRLKPELRQEGGVRVYRFWPLNLYHYLTGPRVPKAVRFLWQLINLVNWPVAWLLGRELAREQPDLVISYNLMGLSFLLPRMMKKLGFRQVHTLHDVQLLHPSGLFMWRSKQLSLPMRFYQTLTRWLFAPVGAVVSPSAWLLAEHQSRGFFPHSRCLVVPNPVPASQGKSTVKNSRPPLQLVYVGQVAEHKGVVWLINAIKKSARSDFVLQIIALGLEPDLSQVAEAAGQDPRLVIISGLTQAEIDTHLAQGHLVIVPSLCYENSPTTIGKALLAGTPVLAANLGGIPELVKEGATGWLFEPGNEKDFLDKLDWCLDHPAELLRVGLNASRVGQDRTLERYVREIIKL